MTEQKQKSRIKWDSASSSRAEQNRIRKILVKQGIAARLTRDVFGCAR